METLIEKSLDDLSDWFTESDVIWEDEVTEDRWESLLQVALENPDWYVVGENFIEIISKNDYQKNY